MKIAYGAVFGVALMTFVVVAEAGCKRIHSEDGDAGGASTVNADPGPYVDPKPGAALPDDAAWVSAPSGTDVALTGVWLSPDLALAVAVGQRGTVLTSKDRGVTWSSVASNVTVDLKGVWGTGPSDVFVVGAGSTVLHSIDGAHTWSKAAISTTADILCVWGSGPNNVFVGGSSATIFRSRNGGVSFESVPTPALTRIAGIWGVDPNNIYAVASAGLLISSSSGDRFANDVVSLAEQNTVWASKLDDVYTANGGGVVTRWDGSRTISKTILTPARALHAIWATSANDVYVAGDLGRLAHSSNAGDDWKAQDPQTTADLLALHGAGGVVLATGTRGTILRRTDEVRIDAGAPDAAADAEAKDAN